MDSVLTEIIGFKANDFSNVRRRFNFFSLTPTLVIFFSLIWNLGLGQTLIAGWDFQTTTNGGTAAAAAPSCPTTFISNFGSGTFYLNGTNGASSWIAATTGNELSAFGGTAVNAGTGFSTVTTSPSCLAFLGGTSNSSNGKFAVFKFSMTGYQNLVVSYATQKSGTSGFSSQIWEYSTNGTTWTAAQTITTVPTSFAAITLTSITGLDNSSVAYLRLSLTGATAAAGNNRLDNIQFTATSITTSYTISYNGNTNTSGSAPVSSSYSSGATATVASNTGPLVKTGYSFAGWNTLANGTGTAYAAGATFTITANTTLYAQWTPNNNTVTFDANGGTGTMSAQTIATAATATLTTNTFTNAGFVFSGWNTLANGTGTAFANGASYIMGTANVTLYAQWTSSSLPVCPSASAITPSASQTICQGVTATTLSVTVTNSGSAGTPTLLYQWYYNTTNSNTISGATLISGATTANYTPLSTVSEIGTRYYFCVGYASNNGCAQTNTTQSLASNAVMVTVNAIPSAPTGTSSQNFCSSSNPTFSNLIATGTTIAWYNASTGGTIQSGALTFGTNNYYATQTVSGCESSTRLQVSVTVTTTPIAPAVSNPQLFCNGTNPLISNLSATGNSIQWYSASTGGAALAVGTSLTNGSVYYASQTSALGGCESLRSTGVTATILSALSYGTTAVASNINHLVISQLYGAGGNAGATYKRDFIEIFNPTSNTISLNGYSIQYASNTGTTWASTGNIGNVSIAPGKYFLVSMFTTDGTNGAVLPNPDFTVSVNIDMSASNGKVALVNSITPLSGASPSSSSIIDLVGFGSSTFFEGSASAPTTSATLADFRLNNGCTDSDNNAGDFSSATPSPRNSSSASNICVGGTSQSICNGTTPKAMYAIGATGSGNFTYQWYYQVGSIASPSGSTTTGWTSLNSVDGANTSSYSPTSGITQTTTYACFVTPSGTPTCGTGSWATASIVVTVNPLPAAPTGNNSQSFCSINNPTFNSISVTGSTIKWYNASTGGVLQLGSSALSTGTYYATQTTSGCESSSRLQVSVTVISTASPTAITPQVFCFGTNPTVANLTATGTDLQWYSSSTGTTLLSASTPLVNGNTYYVSQTLNSCESPRLSVVVIINNNSISPAATQNININTNGTTLTVSEAGTPTSRVWLYSNVSGGPYTLTTNTTATSFTPNFSTPGTYYVVCQSTFSASCIITSNQIVINVNNSIPVPDNGCQSSSYATSIFNFPTNLTITKVTVGVKITTTYRGDLILRLVSPSGTEIVLQNAVGIAADNLDALFDDSGTGSAATGNHVIDATYDITCQSQGSPTQPLSTFIGESSQGAWTLKVCDDAASDLAFINDFKVFIVGCTSTTNTTSFTPQSGPVGTILTCKGTGFTGVTAVKFGSINSINYTVINDSTITVEVPLNATTGFITIADAAGCAKKTTSVFTVISSFGNCGSSIIAGGSGIDLFISEVFDGTSGDDQYVEIFNPTSSTIALSGYSLRIIAYGNTGSNTTNIAFTTGASIASGGVYLVRIGQISTSICNVTPNQISTGGGFNGNDEVYLLKASAILDYVPNSPSLSGAGFSQTRNATVTGPSATYIASQWTESATESCANLGTGPYAPGPAINLTTHPQDVNCNDINFTVTAATTVGTNTYLWRYLNPETGLWADVSSIPGVTVTNATTSSMSITGNTAQLINYQFYCQITSGTCNVASNAAQYSYSTRPYYRAKASGNWSDKLIWEMSSSVSNTIWETVCSYPTKENSSAVFIESPFVVTQDLNLNIDYLEIKNGATLKTSRLSKLTVSDSIVGPDFIVNGIWEYNSESSSSTNLTNDYSFGFDVATGTWQLGANGTIIKTNNGSSSTLRSKYEGGMSTIPATANWIIRYTGADVSFTTTATFYPNLIFESNSGLWSPLITAPGSRFTGTTGGYATVKGNFDIGGTGSGTVTVFNENTNVQPMLIIGNLQIRNGHTLTNVGSTNGTGFEVKGNITAEGSGIFNSNGGNGVLNLTGSASQNISGTGIINLRKLFISNTAPLGQNVTISKDISVPDTLQIIQGFVDAGTTTLNGVAKLLMSGGSLQVSKNGVLLPELTGAYQLTGGTVIFNGNGVGVNAQIIRPVNYFNLTSSNIGDRIMPSGITDTVGVANVFSNGSNSFTFTGSTVNYNGVSAQNIASFTSSFTPGKTYNNLVLSNAGIKSLGGVVDVEGLLSLKDNVSFALGNIDLTLKSTLARTASIGKIPTSTSISYGTGRFVIERNIPVGINHGKSWQFLAVPTNGGQTVKQAWQEGATFPNQNLVPGFGTQLTSNLPGAIGLGFDVYTAPGPSIKTFANGIWNGIPNTTTTPIYNPNGYMVFVRGSRSDTTFNATASATILRTRGKVFDPIGNPVPSITVSPNSYTSIGNPYASTIDFTQFTLSGSGVPHVDNTFWVWDPLLGGVYGYGGYQMISGNNGDYFPSPGGTLNYPSGVRCTQIQSGQAFLMHSTLPGAGGTFSFNEDNKVTGSSNTFRPVVNRNSQYLRISLQSSAATNNKMLDGVVVAFNPRFGNGVDYNDALKMTNTNENFSLMRNGVALSLEARKNVVKRDTVFLYFTNLRRQDYQLSFAPENLSRARVNAKLIDKFLNTIQNLSIVDSTKIIFTVTTDPASFASDRFYIVFGNTSNDMIASESQLEKAQKNQTAIDGSLPTMSVYPNPVQNGILHLYFKNITEGRYYFDITDKQGRRVDTRSFRLEKGNQEKTFLLKNIAQGLYTLFLKEGKKIALSIDLYLN